MWLITFALTSLFLISAPAAVYNSNGSAGDVQRQIRKCVNGDIVTIPAGSFNWGGTVTISGKAITLRGAGSASTTITVAGSSRSDGVLQVYPVTTLTTRVTGIAFRGDWAIGVHGRKNSAPYRIDNCVFDNGTRSGTMLCMDGNGPGLIDHCAFTAGSAAEMIHNNGMWAENTSGWTDEVIPGSASAVYIEDCTFSKNPLADQYFTGTSAIQSYYGARTVMRYCHLNYCQIDQHGNVPPLYGARWWEFYNNTFYVPPNGNQSDYFQLRGGSGVVFNNHVSGGPNTGAGSIQLYSDEHTNPPLCGPGGGIFVKGDRSFSPVYIWGNDSSMPVGSTSSNVIQGRDFFVSATQPARLKRYQASSDNGTTTYSYTPFQYPHPLTRGDANQKSTVERSTSR